MIAGGNVVGKWSENKMEGEDLRTVECLRGRLLAERMASKVAKEYADQMGNKLIELENKLRAEMKSRNKAERRMNLLMKKLGFVNISFAPDKSEHSFEKGEVSSVLSTASSYTKQQEDKKSNTRIANSRKCDIGELMKNTESPLVPQSSDQTSQTTASSQSSNEENFDCIGKAISENSNEPESSKTYDDSNISNARHTNSTQNAFNWSRTGATSK